MSDKWDRWEKETALSFLYFTIYRDIGPTRTIPQVIPIYEKRTGKKGPSVKYLQELSSKFHWAERAVAYDEFNDQYERAQMEKERVRAKKRSAQIADGLQGLYLANLKKLADDYRKWEADPENNPLPEVCIRDIAHGAVTAQQLRDMVDEVATKADLGGVIRIEVVQPNGGQRKKHPLDRTTD